MFECSFKTGVVPERPLVLGRWSVRWLNRRRAANDLGDLLRNRSLSGLVVDQLQFVDQPTGVVGRRLHRHHPRRLLTGAVLYDSLIDQRFGVAQQQVVEHNTRVGLVDVIPDWPGRSVVVGLERDHLLDRRLLRHGVDEFVVGNVDRINFAILECIQHHLDGTDQVFDMRLVAKVSHFRLHLTAKALKEGECLAADGDELGIALHFVRDFDIVFHQNHSQSSVMLRHLSQNKNIHHPFAFLIL